MFLVDARSFALGQTRTDTPMALDPKSSASTNSATRASRLLKHTYTLSCAKMRDWFFLSLALPLLQNSRSKRKGFVAWLFTERNFTRNHLQLSSVEDMHPRLGRSRDHASEKLRTRSVGLLA